MFWFVLIVACGVGGERVLSGLPILANALVPPGLFAAEAESGTPASARVMLAVRIDEPSPFAPQVLEPVATHAFPDWMRPPAERDTQLRLAPPGEVARR